MALYPVKGKSIRCCWLSQELLYYHRSFGCYAKAFCFKMSEATTAEARNNTIYEKMGEGDSSFTPHGRSLETFEIFAVLSTLAGWFVFWHQIHFGMQVLKLIRSLSINACYHMNYCITITAFAVTQKLFVLK